MNNKTFKFSLAKHPNENRYLMYWYKIKYNNKTVSFRAENFVSEEDNEKLLRFHCISSTKEKLLNSCTEILNKYSDKIIKEVVEFLKNPVFEIDNKMLLG